MCMDVEALKWCTNYNVRFGDGKCCQVQEMDDGCGKDKDDVCSQIPSKFTDTSDSKDLSSWLPRNSKYLLCPLDIFSCGAQRRYVYSVDDSLLLGSNIVGGKSLCYYELTNLNNDVDTISLSNFTISEDTAVNIFTDDYDTYFKYLGSANEDSHLEFPFKYNNTIYILATNDGEKPGNYEAFL